VVGIRLRPPDRFARGSPLVEAAVDDPDRSVIVQRVVRGDLARIDVLETKGEASDLVSGAQIPLEVEGAGQDLRDGKRGEAPSKEGFRT